MKDRIIQLISRHIRPVPPEEQMPSPSGLFRGWTFQFTEKEKTLLLLLLLMIIAAILIFGTVTALSADQSGGLWVSDIPVLFRYARVISC